MSASIVRRSQLGPSTVLAGSRDSMIVHNELTSVTA
jgi:hypothetical protein